MSAYSDHDMFAGPPTLGTHGAATIGCPVLTPSSPASPGTAFENPYHDRALSGREDKIRRLMASNTIGVLFWNSDGRIVEANRAFLDIVGYDRRDLMVRGLNWMELTPPEWIERDVTAMEEACVAAAIDPYETEFLAKDGARVRVLVAAALSREPRNQHVAFVLDLSQPVKAARQSDRRYHEIQMALAHANRVATIGHLSASIAHEVSQPIAGIVTNAQTALRMLDHPAERADDIRAALNRIIRDGHRTGQVVSRIRALVKKEAPQRTRFAMNEAIAEVISLARGAAAKCDVNVEMRLAHDLPLVDGDRIQLQQVILNLIMNAVEAMASVVSRRRDLVIETSMAGDTNIVVSVSDTGIGIEEANADKIFNAFHTSKPQGLGLGLSICRSIIEAHAGRLWVNSVPDAGATFFFGLPCAI